MTATRKALQVLLATSVMIVGSSASNADERGARLARYTRVTGVVSFVEHRTFIPFAYCEDRPDCARSKRYWTLSLAAGLEKYEIDQPFGHGSDSAPEMVELKGTVVRPGSRIVVEGRVEPLHRGYSALLDIQSVRYAPELSILPVPEAGTAGWDIAFTPFFGWTCRGVDGNVPFYVDIAQVTREGTYSMRILSKKNAADSELRTLAHFSRVAFETDPDTIEFSGVSDLIGATRRIEAELVIDQRGGRMNDLVSVLKFRSVRSLADWEAPEASEISLACNRTR